MSKASLADLATTRHDATSFITTASLMKLADLATMERSGINHEGRSIILLKNSIKHNLNSTEFVEKFKQIDLFRYTPSWLKSV
jgi:hypothetical protein